MAGHHFNQKLLYINSKNGICGCHEDFSIKLDLREHHDCDRVTVLQANIPKSYYLIQEGYNTFTLTELGVDYQVIITPGNYTRSNLKTNLKTFLNDASGNGWTYNVTFPSSSQVDTGKYTYTVTGNSSNQPSFTFPSTGNIYEVMGFNDASTNVFVGDTIVSTNVVKLQREDTIYIHSDMAGGSTNTLLQDVYAETPDFDHIIFKNREALLYSKPINSTYNNVYRFYLTTENGLPISLNGLNWSMTISIYKKENVIDELKQHIKIISKNKI
jgi:hypothetical protein